MIVNFTKIFFALISNEASIKNHNAQVIVLTDCIGLSQILRSSDNNSRLLEYAIYLGTFLNLSVRYSVGLSLFLADLLTRQFSKVHLQNSEEILSEFLLVFNYFFYLFIKWCMHAPCMHHQMMPAPLTIKGAGRTTVVKFVFSIGCNKIQISYFQISWEGAVLETG